MARPKHQMHVVCPATAGMRAKEKEVACMREEMKV